MKPSVRLVAAAVAGLALLAGLFLGLRPTAAVVTQVSPEVRTLTLPCGIGYLPGVPGTTDPVALRSDPGVLLQRGAYAEHCALVTSWQPYTAWGLTAVGIAGMALLFAGRGRVGVEPGV